MRGKTIVVKHLVFFHLHKYTQALTLNQPVIPDPDPALIPDLAVEKPTGCTYREISVSETTVVIYSQVSLPQLIDSSSVSEPHSDMCERASQLRASTTVGEPYTLM